MASGKVPMATAIAALKVVPKAVTLLWQASPRALLMVLGLVIVQGLTPVSATYFAKLLIDYFAAGKGVTPELWWLVFGEFASWGVWTIARHWSNLTQQELRERSWLLLSSRVVQRAAELDLDFFETPKNYDVLTKALREMEWRPTRMTFSLLSAAQNATTVFGFFFLVLSFSPILALAIVVAVIPTLLAARDSGFLMFQTYDTATPDGRRAQYLDKLLTTDEPAKEVRLYNLSKGLLDRRAFPLGEIIEKRLRATRLQALSFMRAEVFALMFQYGALVYVALGAATRSISVGDFALLATALSRVRQQLSLAFADLGEVLENSLFFSDVTQFLSYRPSIAFPENPPPVPAKIKQGCDWEGVTFTYKGALRAVFSTLSLRPRAGEPTAVVGASGAGKTPLVKLLPRLYEPQEGAIYLDGIDIKSFHVDEYRGLFGVILQDFIRYQLSASENITLSQGWNAPDLTHLQRVANESRVSEIITTLPNGWATLLGRQFDDNGQNLSGGQWQRIALARALYRNAPVLILDEPTAALDAEAEAEVFRAYRDLTRGRLSVLISHRFNTVRMADRILVLEDGVITEDGSHAQLMAKRGRYFEMFTAQAETYSASP